VTVDNPRLLELRRRVLADPASIAFAQLAEECRRAGHTEEAVDVCRAGLVHHPDYLSARVTLGRALVVLGRLDEAQAEFTVVLTNAPDNLAAIRALAEVHQKKGQLHEALTQYKRALELAKFDPDIENEVQRIDSMLAPAAPAEKKEAPPVSIEDLFDFDTLLEQLGEPTAPVASAPAEPVAATPSVVEQVELKADQADPFSRLEQQLRDMEQQVHAAGPSEQDLQEQRALSELEGWLAALVADRHERHSA
jgi:tetratricopeptide (TPR) repeat protein